MAAKKIDEEMTLHCMSLYEIMCHSKNVLHKIPLVLLRECNYIQNSFIKALLENITNFISMTSILCFFLKIVSIVLNREVVENNFILIGDLKSSYGRSFKPEIFNNAENVEL